MRSRTATHFRYLLLIALGGIAAAQTAAPTGKVYIVGMETAPDLATSSSA
jgi:hypothetical protein